MSAFAPLIASSILFGVPGSDTGTVQFIDVTDWVGIEAEQHDSEVSTMSTNFGVGAAIADYDGDGDLDVYWCDMFGWPNHLFANNGDGTFVDVTAAAGVGDTGETHMALFLDLDNDGHDDLVTVNDCRPAEGLTPSRIYRNNGDGTFTDETEGSGFTPCDSIIGGATASDYDHDGDLDIFVVGWSDRLTALYRNEGDFTFTDVTESAGAHPLTDRFNWTPLFMDADGDGWQDIYCAVDFGEDYLLHNNGDGTFTDVSADAGTLHVEHDMGAVAADIDGDLDLDIYATNVTGIDGGPCGLDHGCNILYLNDGTGVFTDGTAAFDVGDTRWGWGTWIFDAELDGHRDLLAVNGWVHPEWNAPAFFFHNTGSGAFIESAEDVGLAHVGDSRALVPIDLEGDGDTDFLLCDTLSRPTVYKNVSDRGDNRWLTVSVQGTTMNRNGVGARVFVEAAGREHMHEIMVGGSFYAGPALRANFGLGPVPSGVADVRVRFQSGEEVLLESVAVDEHIVVVEPVHCPFDLDGTGHVDFADLLSLLSAWGPCAGCPADFDADGVVGIVDLLTVLAAWGPCGG